MTTQEGILLVFLFAMGCCVGSFLNVVIYRLPREKSLVFPGSACPHCDNPIRFYDNIPLVSWLVLAGKCRRCGAPVSSRYFVIEFLTGSVFLGLYLLYFKTALLPQMPDLLPGGSLIYLIHIILLCALIASSAIDLELWIIPLSVCWLVTGAGVVGTAVAAAVVGTTGTIPSVVAQAGPTSGALAVGGVLGLIVSLMLLASGKIKRSYEMQLQSQSVNRPQDAVPDDDYHHRTEMVREVIFLGPVVILAIGTYWLTSSVTAVEQGWRSFVSQPLIAGGLGSLWGYLIGAGVVWLTRILGTLVFGREAMGLGDVHLMGAVGSVIGAPMVTVAFFVAPFFGLLWALFQLFFKKTRQIPYGPFLSLGTFTVMIYHNWIMERLIIMFGIYR